MWNPAGLLYAQQSFGIATILLHSEGIGSKVNFLDFSIFSYSKKAWYPSSLKDQQYPALKANNDVNGLHIIAMTNINNPMETCDSGSIRMVKIHLFL